MKKILLILTLLLSSCSYKWQQEESCESEIPTVELEGVVSTYKIVHYEETRSFDLNFEEKTTTRILFRSPCYVSCGSDYTRVVKPEGERCLKNQVMCSESELPANAVSGIKTLSASGTYGACQVMSCASGYTVQADNTCAGGIIVIPPPFFPPPPMPCSIAPADPMCIP
jgi:hypothetical protein